MASPPPPPIRHTATLLLLMAAVVAQLFPPTHSLPCASPAFSDDHDLNYANCMDLPSLKASLLWTYNSTSKPSPTLSIAFSAQPPSPNGWVAWALNPTGTGMVGSQTLVAFKDSASNGSVVVKTYNISSYGPIAESKISYDVLDKRGEDSGGLFTIVATLGLPKGADHGEVVNQVWQVGASVKNGVPVKHEFSPENLRSKGTLRLAEEAEGRAPAAPPAGGRQSGSVSGGSSRFWGRSTGVMVVAVLIGVSIFGIR